MRIVCLVALLAGAARRLGFQVPAEELGRGIRSLALGMGQLIDALVHELGPERIELGLVAHALKRRASGLALEVGDGRTLEARDVVLGVPARPARRAAAATLSHQNLAARSQWRQDLDGAKISMAPRPQ